MYYLFHLSISHLGAHENVIHIITTFETPCPSIVTLFYKQGDLSNYLKINGGLELSLIIKLAKGITNGLMFLHSNNIIHRDMKSGNILV